jgi:hypothetical protein
MTPVEDPTRYDQERRLDAAFVLGEIRKEADALVVRAQALELKVSRVVRHVPGHRDRLQKLWLELRTIKKRMDRLLDLTLGDMGTGRPVIDEPEEPAIEIEVDLPNVRAPARQHDF